MKITTICLVASILCALPIVAAAQTATPDPDIVAARQAGDRIVARLATAEAAAKTYAAELAQLREQISALSTELTAAQAARAAAEAERDAALRAVADAKAQISALASRL